MKSFLIVIIFIVLSNITHAADDCKIESFAHIIKINKILDDTTIKTSSCTSDIIDEFISLVSNTSGKLNAQYLRMYFKTEHNKNVTLLPRVITVTGLDTFLTEKLNLPPEIMINRSTSMFGKASLNLKSDKLIKITCPKCTGPGEKNIKLNIKNKIHWITSHFFIKRKAYIVSKDIGSINNVLSSNMFKQKLILDKGNKYLFSDMKNIAYYRLNRNLVVGDIVKKNALVPRVLVRAGQKIKLLVNNSRIKLSTTGIARKNGRIGDYIDVINPKSKKKTVAKVIGFNTAVIDI
jgi:flagella basal body P-ring formation protein FlgA